MSTEDGEKEVDVVEAALQSGRLKRDEYGLLVVPGRGEIITPEQVKQESEDDLD